jgi:site-specific DNA-methyltransferase (adenine-specific)
MPEQLLGRIIRLCTDRGDTVLDCFAGSGTTLAVAKKLGRHWIGMEKSAGYAVQIRLRLDSCKDGDVLDGKGAV